MLETKDFKIIDEKLVYSGKIFSVFDLKIKKPNGIINRQIVRHHNAVAILILKKEDNKKKVLLTREYRTGTNEVRWSIPAGLINEEVNEEPSHAAIREAEEETGVKANENHLKFISKTNSSEGFTDEFIYTFKLDLKGNDVQNDDLINFDSDEYVEKKWFTLKEAIELMHENEFYSTPTIIALQNEMINELLGRG